MTPTFGDRLRQLRKEANLKQSEFGELFDISSSAIGSYERNEREPAYKHLLSFADYFHVSLDYLLGRSDERMTIKQYTSKDTFELSYLLDKYTILIQGKELSKSDKNRIKDVCVALFLHDLDI